MGPRKCTIEGCKSISGRPQHRGVTFHTIPNNPITRHNWLANCRLDESRKITKSVLICSRHFLRVDFQTLSNNKYMLKQGAEPTIFPWTQSGNASITTAIRSADGTTQISVAPSTSKSRSEEDRIVNQILEEALKSEMAASLKRSAACSDVVEPKAKMRKSLDTTMYKKISAAPSTPIDPASPLRSGDEIEALDFNGVWHPAKVVEEDHDDNEVLIRFNTPNINIIDEWIPKDSSRLRVAQAAQEDQQIVTMDEPPDPQQPTAAMEPPIVQPSPLQSNLPVLKKAPYNYVVGEKCMAKWTDGRKWKATVQTVLDLDYYDILYIDGITKRCHAKDMSKIKGAEPPPAPPAAAVTPKPQTGTLMGRKTTKPLPIPKFDLTNLNLLPVPKDGEWCCNWVNDTPIGKEAYLEGPDGSRRPTVLVDDWRLPEGWRKHLYQRSSVSGKWDVVLVGPTRKRFRSKNDVKAYLDENNIPYNPDVYDFSIHKRRAKDLGLFVFTEDYVEAQQVKQQQQQQQLQSQVPEQRSNVSISSDTLNQSVSSEEVFNGFPPTDLSTPETSAISVLYEAPPVAETPLPELEEGYVYVGSHKVQMVDNLYRCPEATCNKNFRKESHLQIHVKHYHEDLAKQMGVCLNMSDLAYIRTTGEMPVEEEPLSVLTSPKSDSVSSKKSKTIDATFQTEPPLKVEPVQNILPPGAYTVQTIIHQEALPPVSEPTFIRPESPPPLDNDVDLSAKVADQILEMQSSGHSRPTHKKYKKSAKAAKNRIKIKLKNRNGSLVAKGRGRQPLRHHNRSTYSPDSSYNDYEYDPPYRGPDTQTSTPHKSSRLKFLNHQVSTICDPNVYEPLVQSVPQSQYIDENGEVIKIVRMRQEEIINCICAYAEEDGLMIQCELCLCWQHGFCHGIEKESLVPEKYVCYICQNPQSGRPSMKYVHDQEWLYEGRLPVSTKWLPPSGDATIGDEAAPTSVLPPKHKERFEKLKHSHTLSGNLLDLKRFMHSLQVKINIAENKDHPKMYLWAKKWERSPPPSSNEVAGIEPLVSTVSSASDDKKIIITDTELNDILHQEDDKKSVEVKTEFQAMAGGSVVDDASTLPTVDEVQVINDLMTNEEAMKHMEKAAEEIAKTEVKSDAEKSVKIEDSKDIMSAGDLDSNILAGLLTSPGGTNIDLVSDIKAESSREALNRHNIEAIVPQPEAAIDPVECQLKLLEHIQKQQMLAMARLQSIEADIIGLEAMDEHADPVDPEDNFSGTRQTIFQLLSDLMKMRKLAALNLAEDEQLSTATTAI